MAAAASSNNHALPQVPPSPEHHPSLGVQITTGSPVHRQHLSHAVGSASYICCVGDIIVEEKYLILTIRATRKHPLTRSTIFESLNNVKLPTVQGLR